MQREDVRPGQAVIIVAADAFFGFCDGWHGRVSQRKEYPGGWNNGLAVVECQRADGTKVFFVPPAQLALSV